MQRSSIENVAIEDVAIEDVAIEEKLDLYEAIDRLPEKHRIVIILKYFNEFKISEITEATGIPEGSVKAYLSRARGELKNFLKEDYRYAD